MTQGEDVELDSVWRQAAVVFAAALGFRIAFILIHDFDGLYGQDSYEHLRQVLALRSWLTDGAPFPGGSLWPNGFAVTALPFTVLFGASSAAVQACVAACGAGVAALLFAAGRSLRSDHGFAVGLLAAAVVSVAALPVTFSIVVMSDMPALLWATLACWLLLRWSQPTAGRGWLAAAGAALAMAIITRWVYLMMLPAIASATVVVMVRDRRPWTQLLLPMVCGLPIVAAQLIAGGQRPDSWVGHWVLDWSPTHALSSDFSTTEGHTDYPLPNWLFYSQVAGSPRLLFPLLGLAIPWGIRRLWQGRARPELVLLVGWAGPTYLLLVGLPYQNLRYGLALYPPLVLLASLGAVDLLRRPRWRVAVTAAVALSLAAMLGWSVRATGGFLRDMKATKELAREVAKALPDDAVLLCLGLTHTIDHDTDVEVRELYNLGPADLGDLLSGPRPLYLLVVRADIDGRWRRASPGRNLAWLERRAALVDEGRFGAYTLYRVLRR